jgi:hypothetical protein
MKIKEPFGVTMIKAILLILFVVFLIVVGPLLTIWALNTLFPVLAIDYTWQTWLAVVILGGLFKSSITTKK